MNCLFKMSYCGNLIVSQFEVLERIKHHINDNNYCFE